MQAQPDVFPELLVATVASVEGSGLPQALRRYQHYELRIENIRKKVVGALLYPAAVVAVGFGVLMFMLFFVIPRFAVVFESLQSLPATAQALLWWARLVREHGMALGAGIAGVIVAAVLALRTARIRVGRAQLWRLPKLRDVAFLFVLARFYRTVGLLVEGGTPVLQALELSQRLLPQRLAARLERALAELRAAGPWARRWPRTDDHAGGAASAAGGRAQRRPGRHV